jgi:hypothetical protein
MHRALTAMTITLVLVVASCADPSTPPLAAPNIPTTLPPTTFPPTTVPPDPAGSGLSVASPGEFIIAFEQQMAGTLELEGNGCWFLGGAYGRGPIVFPPGFTLAEDGTTVIGSDGRRLADGTPIDISGTILYSADELPGGADGKWGDHLAFCGLHSGLVVAAQMAAATLPTATEATELIKRLDTSSLVADWPCGYGFAKSSGNQRVGLMIYPIGPELPEGGPVTLPDDRFDAFVEVGSNLFSNNCDDVIEWFEPERRSVAKYEIVSGTFTYPDAADLACAGGPPKTITVTDVVVAVPEGEVTLGTIEITNKSFGCLAG